MSCGSKDSVNRNSFSSHPNLDEERGKSVACRLATADNPPQPESSSELDSSLQAGNKRSSLASRASGAPKPMSVEAERYLTVRDVAQRFAVSIQTVWRWAKERTEFPKPVELSPGTTRWRMSDLTAFERGLLRDGR
ncbi:helix-turn-helix transcriptional regulator [Sinorhizobium prairiense]|uniref:helix-turn-helix transcriptional regulator n=1 Tax=unclassified Sinorhizobium TaxID=2613772 RepID=UPI0023D85C26|nr:MULTISPECIES: AlpA family phage regulatory protein [unclassified Sinorhizobium]WEJ09959.1 AlpA family phage regulatory protein [Sinorhizobium sp. M103]WEJ15490.1 AlpA family phage regulatory protein [Sinorhizobium sp. K101]WEJ36920.1 AlpA family phage regulatory protein [Sinorhizobium sp. C101]